MDEIENDGLGYEGMRAQQWGAKDRRAEASRKTDNEETSGRESVRD